MGHGVFYSYLRNLKNVERCSEGEFHVGVHLCAIENVHLEEEVSKEHRRCIR